MVYLYQTEKLKLFTEEGSIEFIRARDKIFAMLEKAGAIKSSHAMWGPDPWFSLAILDRMVEMNDLYEVTGTACAGQHRVFVRSGGNP